MWRRKAFNRLRRLGRQGRAWADRNPRPMVALMFGVMVTGLTWQLYARSSRQESYFSPLAKAYGEFGRLQTRSHDKALTGDVLELMGLYTRAQAIHPDSLTARDSTFLVDLDKQLNSIINEKD